MTDDDLSLVPIDDEAEQPLAPREPFDPEEPTVPILCGACRLRFYAPEKYIGLWTPCPDCGRRNEIRKVDPKFRLEVEISDDGGYGVHDLEEGTLKPKSMPHKDYSVEGDNKPVVLPPQQRVFDDAPQAMERFMSNLLLSKQEKARDAEIRRRKEEIEAEMYDIRQAARDGTLEKHVQDLVEKTEPSIVPAAEIDNPAQPVSPAAPPVAAPRTGPPVPPPLPSIARPSGKPVQTAPPVEAVPPVKTALPIERNDAPVVREPETLSVSKPRSPAAARTPSRFSPAYFFAPFFAVHNRKRLIVLLVLGLLACFFGENARVIVYQVLFEKTEPGTVLSRGEQLVFFVHFLVGAFLWVLWIGVLFLLGVSIFLDTAAGSRTVTTWIPFDINHGLGYLGWTLAFVFLSGIPGYLSWFFFLASSHYASAGQFIADVCFQITTVALSVFFVFPVLFLSAIESETFLGGAPRKTLRSLCTMPGAWTKFLLLAVPIFGGMMFTVVALFIACFLYEDAWFFQSPLYYPLAAIWIALPMSLFPLIYFRLLGRLSEEIDLHC